MSPVPDGFVVVPTTDVEIKVTESFRYGAPMTLVRGGEDRDLQGIAAMGHARADPFRFHINRDVDLIKDALTRKRLLAGLGLAGARQLEFVIAEEGITAAAYIAIGAVRLRIEPFVTLNLLAFGGISIAASLGRPWIVEDIGRLLQIRWEHSWRLPAPS